MCRVRLNSLLILFFFNDTATTEIYTLSLHDALPIFRGHRDAPRRDGANGAAYPKTAKDRKSTRLNSSHRTISYAVFCLKKKKHNLAAHRAEPQIDTHGKHDQGHPRVSDDARRGDLVHPHEAAPRRPDLFFFDDTATTEIYTRSLRDALPI